MPPQPWTLESCRLGGVRAAVAARWLAIGVLGLSLSGSAHAEPAALEVHLGCEPALGPGRVRCSIEVQAPPKQRLSWVDALVVQAPSFARPLRARIAHRVAGDAVTRAALPFALMATSTGQGRLTLRARAVLCPESARRPACRPVSAEATLDLRVGGPLPEKFARLPLPLISAAYESSRPTALDHAR